MKLEAGKRLTAIALALAAFGWAGASAATQPVDSASVAVATVWADVVGPSLRQAYAGEPDSAAVVAEYINGLSETLPVKGQPAPRMRGQLDGVQIASRLAQLAQMGVAIDTDQFLQAFAAALTGQPTGFTPAAANAYMERRMNEPSPAQKEFAAEQQRFLAQAASRDGAVTTPSGLVFEVVTEGEGAQPSLTDRVKVNYTGRLADGTEFDSSKDVEFEVGRLVKGFTEGLTMMKPGGTYRLYIPAALGYGERGAGGVIPPGAALEFTVDLLEVL